MNKGLIKGDGKKKIKRKKRGKNSRSLDDLGFNRVLSYKIRINAIAIYISVSLNMGSALFRTKLHHP